MRVTYYSYYLQQADGTKTLYDITTFLDNFLSKTTISYKKSITNEADENLYLFKISQGSFMFVVTKNNDLAKLVDTAGGKLEVEDLLNKLNNDENLGFASYVCIKRKAFAYSATMSGPKVPAFLQLINNLLAQDLPDVELIAEALTRDVSFSDLMKFDRIGKVKYKFDSKSSLAGLFGCKTGSINYFEVRIIPKRGEDIRDELGYVEAAMGQEVKDMIVTAKENINSELMDYFIFADGAIADKINKSTDNSIIYQMEERFRKNSLVLSEMNKIKEGAYVGKSQDMDILFNNFKWPSTYTRI